MSTPVTTYDKRPVIVSPTAPTSLEQLRYLWLDISEMTPVLRYHDSTGTWKAINDVDTSSFLTTNGVQTITGAKDFNAGTITVADITLNGTQISGIDASNLTNDDVHIPTSKSVFDALVLKQNQLQMYQESVNLEALSTVTIGNGGYDNVLNIGGTASNSSNIVNIGGSANFRTINIAATAAGESDNVNIGNTLTNGVLLTLNTERGLAGTGVTKNLTTSATDTQFPTAAAVKAVTDTKADKATTLSGYGITDANIASGVITLGSNTITPLTANSTISASNISGTVASATKATQDGDGNVISSTYATAASVEEQLTAKQDTLIAGSYIDINNNTISVVSLTKAAVGLGNVDNTSDANKPISNATQTELNLKQNITDNTLTTTAKTIPGAINELKTATDSMVVVSTDNAINVAPTTAQIGVLIASSKTNGGNVIITPKISNTGACYLSTSSTYSNLNPIYPDPTNNKYTYPNLGAVYLFVDNAGDSADIVIENFAG